MSFHSTEQQLRFFLLAVTAAVFVGTLVEVSVVEHMESAVQLVPFGLAGIGLVAVAGAMFRADRRVLVFLRVVMVIVALGGIFGIYEHFQHNIAFEIEVTPGATRADVFWEAFGGATPFLAPGILTLGAVLAIGATYRHPVLES